MNCFYGVSELRFAGYLLVSVPLAPPLVLPTGIIFCAVDDDDCAIRLAALLIF